MMKALLLTVLAGALLAQDPGAVKVIRDQSPHRVLKMDVVIPAPVEAVWRAFNTEFGKAPDTILESKPNREIVIHASAPEWYPSLRPERTTAIYTFTPQGASSTLVHLEQTGWKHTHEWDKAYEYVAASSAQMLDKLRREFTPGTTQ